MDVSTDRRAARLEGRQLATKLSRGRIAGLAGLALLMVSRRPDVLLNAQFWAEDGTVWYADAYNSGGFEALFDPVVGYLQSVPRLAALGAMALPLTAAPVFFNSTALLIQFLPVLYLLSDRLNGWAQRRTRLILAFLYVVLPNTHEVFGNITNAQWHLAALAILILGADPAPSRAWAILDLTMLAACALTGPFAILLTPLAVWAWLGEGRDRFRGQRLLILGAGAAIQTATLLFWGSDRIAANRAASPLVLVHILARQVVLPLFAGRRQLYEFAPEAGWPLVVAFLAVLMAVALQLYALVHGPRALRMIVLFGAGILTASLAYPMVESPQWPTLAAAGGIRYWLLPMFSLCAALTWLVESGHARWLRGVAAALLVVMLAGIVQDYGHPRPRDLDFLEHVRDFEAQPPGTRVEIPINPEGWSMVLIR